MESKNSRGPVIAVSARLAASRLHYAWVIIALTFVVIVVTAGVRATPGVLIRRSGRAGRRTGQLSTHLTKVQPASRTDCGVANRNRGAPGLAEKRELHSRGAGACTSFTLLPARSIHSRARRA